VVHGDIIRPGWQLSMGRGMEGGRVTLLLKGRGGKYLGMLHTGRFDTIKLFPNLGKSLK